MGEKARKMKEEIEESRKLEKITFGKLACHLSRCIAKG
jgi:hypothetical protein